MITPSLQFDYHQFAKLSGDLLVEYAHPFANSRNLAISPEDIERLRAGLDDYDEYHLVYAIEIGTDNSPSTFASEVPRFLGHEKMSVFCAVDRVLRRLKPDFITPSLLSQVEQISQNLPERRSHIESLVESLRSRSM